jgi:CheY-like chemotaxis protein
LPGVNLIPAVQGSIGIGLAREHRPDLILLDLHFPDASADSVLSRLKSDPRTASIPVLLVGTEANTDMAERLESLGASWQLPKPIDVHRLLDLVQSHLPMIAGDA